MLYQNEVSSVIERDRPCIVPPIARIGSHHLLCGRAVTPSARSHPPVCHQPYLRMRERPGGLEDWKKSVGLE